MFRLAMFIAVVLLLFQAGFHRVGPAPAAGPSPLYPELATLARGDRRVAPLPANGGWLWVNAENAGLSGYVAAGLVARGD